MLRRFIFIITLICSISLLSQAAVAEWKITDLDKIKNMFVWKIADKYRTTEYPWVFLDPATCFSPEVVCYFSNPDGPYGHPKIGEDLGLGIRMSQTDALVLIMETPPPMRYFGVTPYIYSHFYSSLPNDPSNSGTVMVFESLGDSVNLSNVKTAGCGAFTELSVFIMTADQRTMEEIYKGFAALGFPEDAINKISMPLDAVPLRMGKGPAADTYTILMRLAYPEDPYDMSNYISRNPVKYLHLSANTVRTTVPLPTPASKIPGSGVSESTELKAARDQLVETLKDRYGNSYFIREKKPFLTQTINYICVEKGISCNIDNSDGLYTRDINTYIPSSPEDKILIVGVNHVDTGKTTYVSHSVVNDLYHVGVVAVNDDWLRESALEMAGITDINDPRYSTYSQLYAFTIGYDCTNEPVCLTIPQPTESDPVGITFGDPLDITARQYLDPATGTRPSDGEVIFERVFILKEK